MSSGIREWFPTALVALSCQRPEPTERTISDRRVWSRQCLRRNSTSLSCAAKNRLISDLIDLADHYHLPLLATNGVQYATPNGRQVLDVFTCIREHTHLDAAGKLLSQNSERHLKSDAEMRALFRDRPDAIDNTARLADRLEFSLENIGYEFPSISPFPPATTWIRSCARSFSFGAQQRYEAITSAVQTASWKKSWP